MYQASVWQKERISNFVFIAALVEFVFCILVYVLKIDFYEYILTGALFEILWLPLVLSIFGVPLLSLLIIFKSGVCKFKPVAAIILILLSVLVVTFYN